MAIFRVKKTQDYTVMSNHHLKNYNLSLKAKGLLSQILSLPDNWDYTLKGLSIINRESIDAIRLTVQELESEGYLSRTRECRANGTLGGVEFIIHEIPLSEKLEAPDGETKETEPADGKNEKKAYEKPVCCEIADNGIKTTYISGDSLKIDNPTQAKNFGKTPTLDKPTLDKPTLDNPTQLNTNILNTYYDCLSTAHARERENVDKNVDNSKRQKKSSSSKGRQKGFKTHLSKSEKRYYGTLKESCSNEFRKGGKSDECS